MAYCSIVGCSNKQANNNEVTYFNLPKDPQRRKNWLAKTNILINHGIYKTGFFTQTDQ